MLCGMYMTKGALQMMALASLILLLIGPLMGVQAHNMCTTVDENCLFASLCHGGKRHLMYEATKFNSHMVFVLIIID